MPFHIFLNLACFFLIRGIFINLITATVTQSIFFSNYRPFSFNKNNILWIRAATNLCRNLTCYACVIRSSKVMRWRGYNSFGTTLGVSVFRFSNRACIALWLYRKSRRSNISTNKRLWWLSWNWFKLSFNLLINILITNNEEIWCFIVIRWPSIFYPISYWWCWIFYSICSCDCCSSL